MRTTATLEPHAMPTSTALADLLMDLAHDLGKYIRMPLAFLPRDAPAHEVHAALRKALLETRPGPRSARQVWAGFLAEAGVLPDTPAFHAMRDAVEHALRWEAVARAANTELDRTEVEADLNAVHKAVRNALAALEDTP